MTGKATGTPSYQLLQTAGKRMIYACDFADDWLHDIVVEALGEPVQRAYCLDGEGACPPEDSGGPWGYADLLAALDDPTNPAHEDAAEFRDGLDPVKVSRETTNLFQGGIGRP